MPIKVNKEVKALIDIDAPIYSRFTREDGKWLEKIADLLSPLFNK